MENAYQDIDLIEYDKPELLMTGEQWWECQRMGGGTPPIKTEYWLELFIKANLTTQEVIKDIYHSCGTVRRLL